ncbi:MAG TPA: hypothetical protein VJX67_06785 [Blastocatellia bacterium]|nr:hypothetical protein [Blastocatellia bacterium]
MKGMNSNSNAALGLLLVLFLLGSGCGPSGVKREKLESGTLEGSTYVNQSLGLTVSIPRTWLVQDSEAQNRLTQRGKNALSGRGKDFDNELAESEANTVILLTLRKYPEGAASDINPMFMIAAENLDTHAGINTGNDYLAEMKNTMEKGGVKLPLAGAASETFGGVVFDSVAGAVSTGKLTVNEKMFATVRKGYAVAAVAVYADPVDWDTIKGVLRSMEFK